MRPSRTNSIHQADTRSAASSARFVATVNLAPDLTCRALVKAVSKDGPTTVHFSVHERTRRKPVKLAPRS